MAYNTTILADSPLVYFQLNETSGTTFANSGSLGGTSSAIGSGVTKGQINGIDGSNAIALDGGANAYFSFSQSASFMSDNIYSVEAWVKTTTGGVTKTIASYNPGSRGFTLGVNSSNRATFSISNNNGTFTVTASGSTNLLNDGNWHHLVGTVNSSTITIYVDGVSTQNTSATAGTYGITASLYAGASGSGAFNGQIDEFAIYDGALTSTQVTTHYNANPTGTPASYSPPAMTASASLPMPTVSAQKQVNYSVPAMTASGSMPNVIVPVNIGVSVAPMTASATFGPGYAATKNVELPVTVGITASDSPTTPLGGSYLTYDFGTHGTAQEFYFQVDLSSLPSDAVVGNGYLQVNIIGFGATPPATGAIYPVTSSFNTSTVTHNSKPTKGSQIGTYSYSTGGIKLIDVSAAMQMIRAGTAYGFVLVPSNVTTPSNQIQISGLTDTQPYRPDAEIVYYASGATTQSVAAMTASASMPVASVVAGTGSTNSVSPLTASALAVMPSVATEQNPDVSISVGVMNAAASMPGGYFQVNVTNSVAVATASASMPNVSVSGELNARVNVNVMVGAASIIPPVEAQGNDSDPYYLRLNSQVTETDALWYRMDEVSGTTALNERGGGNGTYVGGPTLGVSGLEGRRVVHFDGVNDGVVFPDNDALTAQGTYEFVFRTTKATETIVQGIDFNFNNFGGYLRGTMIGLTDGKIDIFPSNKGQYTGLTTLNDGQWHHVVVTFYRFGNAALDYAGQLAVYVDGKVELKRYLLENQVFVAIPDGLAGVGSRAQGLPVTQGERANTIPFEGDIMEFVFRPGAVLNETEAIRNYYYAFGYNPIYVEPMKATAEMPNAIGKGNQKRALALFWSTDTDENLNLPNYWDTYNWTGIRTSDTYAAVGPLLSHYRLSAPFDLGGFKVFPRSIQRNETASVDNDYLSGAYYDYVTGEQRYIDLTTDIDVSEYDMVFFLNLPPQKANDVGGVEASAKNWENMVDSVRRAQDLYGFSIWAPQPDLAVQLGVIDRWTVHSMLRETFASDAQGNASGLYDARGPQINPWNTGVGEYADPKFYYDTHAANKYRIVALEDDLTTLGGYTIEDYFYGRPRDPYKIPFEGWKYKELPSGLQIGDEMYYPQDFWAIASSSSWLGVHNQRRSVVAIPPENVKAGTVVTRENDTQYIGTSEVANPFADYATSIIVNPGDTLKGRQANGKIYVNFMEGVDGNFGALRKQIVPPNDQITNPLDREDATKRAWDYTSFRVSATAQTGTVQGPTGGAGQIPIDENTEVENPSTGGGVIVSVNESEKYQVTFLPQYTMIYRAFNWMSIRGEVEPGDKIVRPDQMKANAAMPMPTVTAEKSNAVHVEPMLAQATMLPNTEARGPNVTVRAFPMTALGVMPGIGRTISVEPMAAVATMPFTFDMVHAGGDQIVLYLHYTDAIVYVKEDA